MLNFRLISTVDAADISEIEVRLDADGLDELMSQLKFLADQKTDHVHLMSGEWGGDGLTPFPASPPEWAIHHVKIMMVTRD